MRLVVGSALIVRAGFEAVERSAADECHNSRCALNGAGILLIVGLWTPIVGTSVALIEIWKMLTLAGDKWVWLLLGTAGCRSRNVRTGSMVHRCSPFRLEAHRSSAPQNQLSLSLRLPIYHQISCLRRG